MRDISRAAEKRLNAREREAAEQFDSPIVHNRVYQAIREDPSVRHALDVTERAYDLSNTETGDVRDAAFAAAETLNSQIDRLVTDAVAAELVAIMRDASDGWFEDSDHVDQFDVADATTEASKWLTEHEAAVDRAVDDQPPLITPSGAEVQS